MEILTGLVGSLLVCARESLAATFLPLLLVSAEIYCPGLVYFTVHGDLETLLPI